ncbi:hypothetical protein [Flavobacterium aquidurense]|uniref:hypothetical protein n=1 Tax=Flavobacterium aquidurense TaxID=362413 RepID=UPI00371ABCE7
MTISTKNEIVELLEQYQIEFQINGIIELSQSQNLSLIPSKKIIKILGLKHDEGHKVFIDKLNQIESDWLLIFLKYESYYEVYNAESEIIKKNFYLLIYEILDGLK